MFGKTLLAACLSLILVFGSVISAITETPESWVVEGGAESAVEETPAEEPTDVLEQKLLEEVELQILGAELQVTGMRFRKAYNSFSVVPGTWHEIGEEIDKGNPGGATILAVFILPIDFTLSRFYGNFAGSHHLGKAGGHLIASSKVFPAEQRVMMENAGKNLRAARTYGIFSNALFYGGLIGVLAHDYGSSIEEGGSGSSTPYAAMGAIATSYGLRMLSARYVGSAGARLREIAGSPLANEPLKAISGAGMSLGGYETATYVGNALTVLGITAAIAGRDNGTALKAGIITAAVGWIISGPVAASEIKAAAHKLQEAGDRIMFWNE